MDLLSDYLVKNRKTTSFSFLVGYKEVGCESKLNSLGFKTQAIEKYMQA
jgi:hypothetical protein